MQREQHDKVLLRQSQPQQAATLICRSTGGALNTTAHATPGRQLSPEMACSRALTGRQAAAGG